MVPLKSHTRKVTHKLHLFVVVPTNQKKKILSYKFSQLLLSHQCSSGAQYNIIPSLTFYSSFSGEPSPGSSIRYVETQSMQIGASYSLQFSLVMGCGREPSPHIDTQVRLEFSTNHGLTWHLVKEVSESMLCHSFEVF